MEILATFGIVMLGLAGILGLSVFFAWIETSFGFGRALLAFGIFQFVLWGSVIAFIVFRV